MDYSSSLHDGDNPAEASPWGSSPAPSPQHNRSTFNPTPEAPGSPVYGQNREHGDNYTSDSGIAGEPGLPDEAGNAHAYSQGQGSTESNAEHAPQQPGEQQPSGHPEQQRHAHLGQDAQKQQGISRPAARQGPHYKLQAKITGLERVGRKDPILRFDVHTNIPAFRTTQFRDVRRTHSEFIKLADHLISSNPEAIVPAVPPALTSAGAGTDEDEARVKASLQRWLNYVCGNDVLMRDDEMVLFVESDYGYSPMVKRKQPATGVRRKVIKQFAPPPDDTPELEDARPAIKQFYLGTMDAGHKVDRLVKARKGLGLAESDFGVKLGTMSIQELHGGLANAYRKLGKTIQTTGDYHAAQGTAEATTIGDPLAYHSEDAFIVKETLTNRHILMRELLQAEILSKAKVDAADRLKVSSSVKREKVDEAIAAMDKARSNELHLRAKTQRVTTNLVQETRRWFTRTTIDVRASLREYVLREIEAERRTLATLETIRPDIRAIDASGGLSRLGRESHPAARRASLAASQGPKGDAWSGVPRRPDASRNVSSTITPGGDEETAEASAGRGRAMSGGSSGGLSGVKEEEDDDRVDARNAASRLATSTF